MMNEATIEAVANANAQLSNVDMPTYSEAIDALKSAKDALQLLVKIGRIPASNAGFRDALNVLGRVQS